ncbi:hypothetical protein V0R50_06970 [Pseudomonas sp. 148P]|uniref:Uncharacterized protein n=1 Tax=Pseudomonas ulcerans TaxID=3115852 RepID=A0ABU7HN77_9PSED|nr:MULTISPECIES: hypothetical protein [unclassified Pseudomonas]MEE1922482.1 hypothetical protein [Pseudomonas sp. 147P]MEE1932956.1 hypothetical protein [Pseudomonas sp. 148P]
MKKIVPDPPVLCVRAGLSPEDALRNAEESLKGALRGLALLPEQPLSGNQVLLTDAIIDLKICRAMLTIAITRTTASVPIF